MERVPIILETGIRINTLGTSAKVNCPKEHLGKNVYLVILNHDDE